MRFILWLLLSLFLVRAQDGNGFDPHGKPVTTQSDEGVGLDPFGRTSAQSGPGMDPNGGGGAMDPNGR